VAEESLKILSGNSTVDYHEKLIRDKIAGFTKKQGRASALSLLTIQVGASADIQLYSKYLGRILAKYKIGHQEKVIRDDAGDVEKFIKELRSSSFKENSITGVLVFSPLPSWVGEKIFSELPLDKDVEGRTFLKRNPFGVFSPTAKAVMALLKHLERDSNGKFSITGKHAVMVGHSDLVGKPTAMLLSDSGATVTVCHKETPTLKKFVSDAEILVVAIGKPGVVQASWIKPGAVVVDVGETLVNGKVVGDVDYKAILKKVSYVSPVPGGVGPITPLMVIENLLTLYEYRLNQHGNH